ncbi:single-stranded DNA-binding protein [Bifidobacterium goeldii]|uniref:Single-stranded DNA-binding protein n=1 Tax=Bifidobacterium goeldii TaxID=2306975 RepID=A0A430FDN9_9BIFI|nr:single-stranded DNA-binding protein [Bifidobacterium goeldii]RSX50994.1 single-stranded DNA-binding protein [Bifidobacterium goeldii]
MAGETIITVVGNLTRDPELRTVGSGSTVVNFTIAASTRQFNRSTNQWEDGDTLFMNCSAWDSARSSLASNIASSLSKGMRVIAQGRLTQRSYQAQDGSQRTVVELRVDEIGPSLTRATAQVNRQSGQSGFAGRGNNGGFAGGNPGNGGYNAAPAQGYQGGAGYSGGAGYAGGAGYSGGASAAPQQHAAPAAPAADPWSTPANDDGFSTFGGSTDFGGGSDEPEF